MFLISPGPGQSLSDKKGIKLPVGQEPVDPGAAPLNFRFRSHLGQKLEASQ
jgi:hypothetical protein